MSTSITAAIRTARKNVEILPFGRQWQVNTWSEHHRAWWQGQPTDYSRARKAHSEAVTQFALEALGAAPDDAAIEAYNRGRSGAVRARVSGAARALGLL